MKPESELTRPLKARTLEKGKREGMLKSGIILGLLILVAAPVGHFYGLFDGLTQQPSDGQNQAVEINLQPKPVEEVEIVLRNTIDEKKPVSPSEPATITELKPSDPGLIDVAKPRPIKKAVRQEQTLAHLPDPELIERGAAGVIPKRSPDGLRPMDVYSRQPDTEGNFGVARVVLVIGGLGLSQTSTQKAIRELPGGVTFAFAPYGNSLARWMQQARKGGHELLMQIPMEPIDYPQNNPGPHTLKNDAEPVENLTNLHWAMSRMTNYVGVMNYLGNRLLTEQSGLRPVFDDIAERGLLFFEDGSVKNSIAEGMAVRSLLPFAKAHLQIDNVRSRAAIAKKLEQLSQQAKRTGLAIGVGNAFPDTITMVAEFARKASQSGIEITPVSAVVSEPKSN